MRNIPLIGLRLGSFWLSLGIGPDWGENKFSVSALWYQPEIKFFTIFEVCLWLPSFGLGFSW